MTRALIVVEQVARVLALLLLSAAFLELGYGLGFHEGAGYRLETFELQTLLASLAATVVRAVAGFNLDARSYLERRAVVEAAL